MGYDYFCLVGLSGKKKLGEADMEKMEEEYKHLIASNEDLTVVGQLTRGRYSCGTNDDFLPAFFEFSRAFPKYTFRLYFSCFDFDVVEWWEIRGSKVLKQGQTPRPEVVAKKMSKMLGFPVVRMEFSIETLGIERDITGALNEDYGYDITG